MLFRSVLAAANDAGDKAGRLIEVDGHGRIVWEHRFSSPVAACQRLADGHTLVALTTPPRTVEIAPGGTVLQETVLPAGAGGSAAIGGVRRTPRGTYLCAFPTERCVREVDAGGQILRELRLPHPPNAVIQLRQGNLLVASDHGLFEYAEDDRVVWHLYEDDIPGLRLRQLAGITEVENGSILVCNRVDVRQEVSGAVVMEITRNRQPAWMLTEASGIHAAAAAVLLPVSRP